eukprot:6201920-Pleurochrysis_carterae.AAC.3
MQITLRKTRPFKRTVRVCRNYTSACVLTEADSYFDFIYVDARQPAYLADALGPDNYGTRKGRKGGPGGGGGAALSGRKMVSGGEQCLQKDRLRLAVTHDYLGVKEDLESWWPKLRPGGVICPPRVWAV